MIHRQDAKDAKDGWILKSNNHDFHREDANTAKENMGVRSLQKSAE